MGGVIDVVGAAICSGGRVLAARRTSPAEAAGRWEFPGGKVEAGESRDHALAREVREELGCDIEVVRWWGPPVAIGPQHRLSVAQALLLRGEPIAREHDQVRWLTVVELGDVDWLEPDRPFLTAVAAALRTEAVGPFADPRQ